ncbi:MAG: branched-chain amino acid ABC transporter permease [Candidatus Rokubacteria bacterium]|nr:branched-chain amino acid ABC transporter permease [Candidatus Rokubacteria bacterium]
MTTFILEVAVLINIYIILGVSFNLLVGYAGLFSVAHAAFYGIGAYTTALLMAKLGVNFFLALALAVVVTALLSIPLAIPSLRVSGDYLVIASFGFQLIMSSVFNNLAITGGAAGLPGIPKPVVFGYRVAGSLPIVALSLGMALLCLGAAWRVTTSPFGRVLRAIRDDEVAAQSAGKNVQAFKVITFAISAAMAAVAGGLYGVYVGFISPPSFAVMESFFIFVLVIVGGTGTLRGSVIGAVVLIALPEALRFVRMPEEVAFPLRQILYAVLVILFMIFRPQGLLGEQAPREEQGS